MNETLPAPSESSAIPRLAVLVPLEQLAVLESLSGADGTNRARGAQRQLNADKDREALLA